MATDRGCARASWRVRVERRARTDGDYPLHAGLASIPAGNATTRAACSATYLFRFLATAMGFSWRKWAKRLVGGLVFQSLDGSDLVGMPRTRGPTRWPSRYKRRRREGASRRQLADAAGLKAERAARTFYGRCGELATLGGNFLYALVLTPVLAYLGAKSEIVHLHKSVWFWLFFMTGILAMFFFYVAYKALVERDHSASQMSLPHIHPPALGPGESETFETMPTAGGGWKVTRETGEERE
jgi:hypothetical protein